MLRHPRLQVQIDVENRPINPLTEPYDSVFAMLESQLPSSSVVIRRMFSLERDLFAAPALVQRLGPPQHPDALRRWPLIASSADAGWSFVDSDGIDHIASDIADKRRLMPGTAAGDDADFSFDRSFFIFQYSRVVGFCHAIIMAFRKPFQHIFDNHVRIVNNSLHRCILLYSMLF